MLAEAAAEVFEEAASEVVEDAQSEVLEVAASGPFYATPSEVLWEGPIWRATNRDRNCIHPLCPFSGAGRGVDPDRCSI